MTNVTTPTQTITREQYDHLTGFFLSLWTFYHHKEDKPTFDSKSWAEILDNQKIPWFIQNTVSNLARTRANAGYYLSTLLSQKGVTITPA